MDNYKINIDKPNPSKKDTEKFKNFDNLVNDYKKLHSPWQLVKVMYKDRKVIRLLVLIAAVAAAIVFGVQHEEQEQKKEETTIKK